MTILSTASELVMELVRTCGGLAHCRGVEVHRVHALLRLVDVVDLVLLPAEDTHSGRARRPCEVAMGGFGSARDGKWDDLQHRL